MDDDPADVHGGGGGGAVSRPPRPWTTDASSVIRDIQLRIKRPTPVRKSVALQRARQIQLAKMAKLNDELRQEVTIAADDALHSAAAAQLGLDRARSQAALIRRLQSRRDALDQDLSACRARLLQLKRTQGGETVQVARERRAQGALARLESRLQRSWLKQNDMHAANEAFKQQQEAMRRDLAIADAVQVGLGQQLAQVQHGICAVTAAYDDAVRHNARSQETLASLQRAADNWHTAFHADWAALAQLLADQTRELHSRRALTDRRRRRTRALTDSDAGGVADGTDEDDDHDDDDDRRKPFLKRQAGAKLDCLAALKATAATQAALDQYVAKAAAIGTATGIGDVDRLIRTFQEQEQDSFRLFREANELARQKEEMAAEAAEAVAAVGVPAAGAAGADALDARLAAAETDFARLGRREASAAADMKQITERVGDLVGGLAAPNRIGTLKDGLELLEAYVADLVGAYKDLYHIRENGDADELETILADDAFADQAGVEICIPTLSDAEPDEDLTGRRASVARRSVISSADNALSLFVRGVTDQRPRRCSSMGRRQSQRAPSSPHRRSDAAMFDPDNDFD